MVQPKSSRLFLRSKGQNFRKWGSLARTPYSRQGITSSLFLLGVSPDLQSGVKKCPNLFSLCGFAIRSKGVCFSFCWGITNPPVLIGRTFFTADCKSAGTPSGLVLLETPYALNQRSPAEGKGKGQKLLAQGITLG